MQDEVGLGDFLNHMIEVIKLQQQFSTQLVGLLEENRRIIVSLERRVRKLEQEQLRSREI